MGWGGIQNVQPGFDVFAGKQGEWNIVEEALRGRLKGLSPVRQGMFADLKRNLLHQDYARYFDGCLPCSEVLLEIEGGKYRPEVLRDLIEPALKVAVDQMNSIQKDLIRSQESKRKLEYDAQSSLDHLYRKSRPIALAYPDATAAKAVEATYNDVTAAVRAAASP